MPVAIGVGLKKDCTRRKFGSIGSQGERARGIRELEGWLGEAKGF